MNTKNQKRLTASVLGCSQYRVRFDTSRMEDIKEAITKADIRSLVNEGVISEAPVKGNSRGRYRANRVKKKRGQGKGHGKRKGTHGARLPHKKKWMNTIRSQRNLLAQLRDRGMIENKVYRDLYLKSKGGFFRNKRHIKLYLEENKLMKNG